MSDLQWWPVYPHGGTKEGRIFWAAVGCQPKRQYENLHNEINAKDYLPTNKKRITLLGKLELINPSEAYNILSAIQKSKKVPGDVCEFGVARGITSAVIANEIKSGDKNFHLFDSFEGLSKPSDKDVLVWDSLSLGSVEAYEGAISYPKKQVLRRLKNIGFPSKRIFIHEGYIENVINENIDLPIAVSFAFVDFDLYEPIRDALNFLHNNTSKGAIVIVHDYAGFMTGPKKAVDEFLLEKNSIEPAYNISFPSYYRYSAILQKII